MTDREMLIEVHRALGDWIASRGAVIQVATEMASGKLVQEQLDAATERHKVDLNRLIDVKFYLDVHCEQKEYL